VVQGLARERAALSALALIARNFYSGGRPLDTASLSGGLGISDSALQEVLSTLVKYGVLMAGAGEPRGYLPARDPSTISLKDIVEAVRSGTGETVSAERGEPADPAIEEVLQVIDEAVSASLSARSLKDLVSGSKG
jgi:membrane protein